MAFRLRRLSMTSPPQNKQRILLFCLEDHIIRYIVYLSNTTTAAFLCRTRSRWHNTPHSGMYIACIYHESCRLFYSTCHTELPDSVLSGHLCCEALYSTNQLNRLCLFQELSEIASGLCICLMFPSQSYHLVFSKT